MKVLVKIFIFVGILYASLGVKAGLRAEDVDAILKHYGYGHLEYRDGQIKEKDGEEDKDCSPRVDQWGGRMFKTGVWGRDERRPIDIDESTLPAEMRLSAGEKRQLRAVGAVLCTNGPKDIDGTGFIVDIDVIGANPNRKYDIIATASHVMFDRKTGKQHLCQYYPDSKNMNEFYDMTPVECGAKRLDESNNGVNGKDWCYARIEKRISDKHGKLKIDFSDQLDWKENEREKSKYFVAGWRPDNQRIEVAGNCSPDDKSRYSNFMKRSLERGDATHELVISDCDAINGASGGPLMVRTELGLRVLGMNKSTITQTKFGDYNPDEGRADVYTKFTKSIESKLKQIIQKLDSI